MKRLGEPTQKCERANIGIYIVKVYYVLVGEGNSEKNVPVPEFSSVILEDMTVRMALQQSSASGA